MSCNSQDRTDHTKTENNPIISVVLNNRFSFLTHTTCPLWVNREVHLILVAQGLKLINTANHQPRGKWSSEGSSDQQLDVKPGNDTLLLLLAHWPELVIRLLLLTKVPEVLILTLTLEEETQKYSRHSTNDYHISSFIDLTCLGFLVRPSTSPWSPDFLLWPVLALPTSPGRQRVLLLPFHHYGAISMSNLPAYPSCTLSAYKAVILVVSMTTKTI